MKGQGNTVVGAGSYLNVVIVGKWSRCVCSRPAVLNIAIFDQ